MGNGLLTEEEVKSFLDIDSREMGRLKQRGRLTAYRVGGAFVRYRKEEVLAVRNGRKFQMPDQFGRGVIDTVRDFLGFYGAYILLSIAVALFIVYFVSP